MSTMIHVRELGKQYRLGQLQPYTTLRDTIAGLVTRPFRRSVAEGPSESARESRRRIWALRDVSFDVEQGESLAIVGRNGSGKSTLLKILARITSPTTGRAMLSGRVGSLLEVGTGFHPELTGRENIYLNGAVLGLKQREIQERFERIAEFSGVSEFLDTPVKRYSSGMYVRLAFSVAAHLEPEVLLVDEVLSVGDAEFQRKCLRKMTRFAESGRTIVFVSHNMWAVRHLCQRAILLEGGRIAASGATEEVVQHYLQGTAEGGRAKAAAPDMGEIRSYRVENVALRDMYGAITDRFEISRGAYVEISYEVLQAGAEARFSFVLFDEFADCVFGSLNNTDSEYYGVPLDPGRYVTTCEIPADLLNAGRFSVSLICAEHGWSGGQRLEQVLQFTALDDGFLRGDYTGGYSGALRPRLRWTTRKEGPA